MLTTTTTLKNTTHDNLNQAQKPDEFVKSILKEKHKLKGVDQNKIFKRWKSRKINFTGPLSGLWSPIEKAHAKGYQKLIWKAAYWFWAHGIWATK